MNVPFFIALRYLRSKRRTGFISLVTYISAAGVMIGTAALVVTLSVMNGFESEVRGRIIGADAHIRLTTFNDQPIADWNEVSWKVKALPGVVGVSPFILGKGMLRSGSRVEGVVIKGVDRKTVGQVSDLPQTIIHGSLFTENVSNPDEPPEQGIFSGDAGLPIPLSYPGIVIGKQLGIRLGSELGDTIILMTPTGMTSLWSMPSMEKFQVVGIFETGIYEYDDAFVYIPLTSAQKLFNLGEKEVSGLEIKTENFEKAGEMARKIEETLPYPYWPRTWWDMHRTLFRWLKIEKWLYTLLLSLIILVAAFNIISSQIMMVLEKKKEIGILKAIGASRQLITHIFMLEGFVIGVSGSLTGLLIGWALCRAQQVYKFFTLPGDVYFLSSLPVQMKVGDFIVVALVALSLTLMATVYPARRAARLDPVEVIRFE